MELTAVAKRVSNVQQFAFTDGAEWSLSGIRRSSATGGALMYSMKGKKTPVPELASAIWSESAIGGSAIGGSTVYMHIHACTYMCN